MDRVKSCLRTVFAGALLTGASAAWAGDQTTPDQRIAELEAKINALEAKDTQNSKEMAATIDSVLRDAERRSQLLGASGDVGAGYDNGFYIRSGDAWLLRPEIVFQFRSVTDYRTNTGGAKDDEVDNGFEIRRLLLILEGTAFTKDLTYFFRWDTAQEGGGVALQDAWVRYMFADDWGFRLGQFKDPVTHEFLLFDGRLLAVDRSMADQVLGGGTVGRTQGATLIYGGYSPKNPIYIEAGLTDGTRQLNTDFTKHAFDFGVVARAEWKVMGQWADYRDQTAKGHKEDLLVIGIGGDWSQSGDGDQIVGDIDLQWETATGWGVYAGLLVRNLDSGLTASGESTTDWGGEIQVAYMLNQQWELFGRWSFVDFDNELVFATGDTEDFFHEITVGFNYYLGNNGSAGHRAKVTIDLNWLPNGSPGPITALGYTGDSSGDNEVVIRGQFQLWL